VRLLQDVHKCITLSVCLNFKGEDQGMKEEEPVVSTLSVCLSLSVSLSVCLSVCLCVCLDALYFSANVPSSPLPGPPRWHADDQTDATVAADVDDNRAMSGDSRRDHGHAWTSRMPARHAAFSHAQSPPDEAIPPTSQIPNHNRPAFSTILLTEWKQKIKQNKVYTTA